MFRSAFGRLLLLALSLLSNVAFGGGKTRYVIAFPGNRLPADLSISVRSAQGEMVRAIPRLGIAVAVSSNAQFASSLSQTLSLSPESIGAVTVTGLAETIARPGNTPMTADTAYQTGPQWGIKRVRADLAWRAGVAGSHHTVVAIIDSGVAWNHPDLRPNVVLAKCMTSAPECNPYPEVSDHATHLAGIIAATFGNGGVVGVGPKLGLASYNVFEYVDECGYCSYADSRWAAMMDAVNRGFGVINISQGQTWRRGGGSGSSETAAAAAAEKRVANYVTGAGAVIVGSAGNTSSNLTGPLMHLPGDVPGYVNVGAVAIRPVPRYPARGTYDVLAFYSNYGAPLTVAAPGGDCGTDMFCDPIQSDWFEYQILSTVVSADPFCAAIADCPIGYDWKAGTSMAAAHVSGVAGLIRDVRPGLAPPAVEAVLKKTADSVGSRLQFGHGVVNAYEAIRQARLKK